MLRITVGLLLAGIASAADVWVSPSGDDRNPGTNERPLRTFAAAQQAARAAHGTVWVRAGTYYLPETVVLTPEDSGLRYAAAPGEHPVISGGIRLDLKWEPYRDGILRAKVPAGLKTDQLFVNGERQHLARYPNYDPAAKYFDGWSADAISRERARRWADPRGGFIHAMHRSLWGDMHWVITGKDAEGNLTYEGGWQNNRPSPMHDRYRFVENIFEELDAPGEWFLDEKTSTLYFYPPPGLDLKRATVEAVRLRHLVEFRGSRERPVRNVTIRGLTFRHAQRVFMDNREPLLRSDWTVYRGGALFLTGAEDALIEDCFLDQVGGNAIFVNRYNRRVTVRGCHIAGAGANGVAFVGDPRAVRTPIAWGQSKTWDEIDHEPGPRTADYPADCTVEDSLIHRTGRVEKQTAPVQISMSQGITVRHCSIYDVPRAGINISEGTWGGHVIEYCDVFDTVKETGDHGSFNSWGRDRFWGLKGVDLNEITLGDRRGLPLLDAVKPTILRNNRWRCDHGWDIDLDDGSTNYEIYNNLCLNGGLKLREGFYRRVENNIVVNNSFHPHVWYRNSQDVFRHNIVFRPYRPIRVNPPWGRECDFNLIHLPGRAQAAVAAALHGLSGLDAHSIEADAQFLDPAHGDYRVKEGSPALALGFRNFPMDRFGVLKPELRKIARVPEFPRPGEVPATTSSQRDSRVSTWLGAAVRNVAGLGEVSAGGLPGETGVMVLEVPAGSPAAAAGLRKGDVILKLAGQPVDTVGDLLRVWIASPAGQLLRLNAFRQYGNQVLEVRR